MDDDLIMGDDYGDPEESGEESNPIGGESESGGSGSSESGSSEPSSKDINTVPTISANDLRSGIKVLISDATGAIKRASIGDIIALIAGRNAGGHNSLYRGNQIGTGVTNAQWSAIYNGTFDDMFIGDYWLINNIKWRIAAFDYWWNFGNVLPGPSQYHHVVIVPDICLAHANLQSGSTSSSVPYCSTDYYTGSNYNTSKATAQSTIESAFTAGHIFTHKEFLVTNCNASTGFESDGSWKDSTFELMTERMVFGADIYHNNADVYTSSKLFKSVDQVQLPLFALDHSAISIRDGYFLRDLAGLAKYCAVDSYGCGGSYPHYLPEYGIRPAFGIYSDTDPLAS